MDFINTKLEEFNNYLRGKKVAIIGIGVSNIPLIEYFHDLKSEVTVFDNSTKQLEKDNFVAKRIGILHPETLSMEERNALIKEQPAYGNIICRCEMISEGEILDAIHRPLGARSLDGVKRRTRAGMGRGQAGFCSPRTMEILAREAKRYGIGVKAAGGIRDYETAKAMIAAGADRIGTSAGVAICQDEAKAMGGGLPK